jgi:hypothetical protein
MPGFYRGGGCDAVEEWQPFVAARATEAADALAKLNWLSYLGPNSIRDADQNRMGMPDLYCREEAGWGVF